MSPYTMPSASSARPIVACFCPVFDGPVGNVSAGSIGSTEDASMSCASFAPAATGAPYGCWRNRYAHSERDDIRDVQIRAFTHLNTRHCCKHQPAPVAHAATRKVAAQCEAARMEWWELHDEMVR